MMFRSLALSSVLAAAASAELLTIPISKVPDEEHVSNLLLSSSGASVDFEALSSSAVATARRGLVRGTPVVADEEKGEENIRLRDLANAQYYGKIKIGTPAQELMVVFDSGSADFWVPGKECLTQSMNCAAKTAYDKESSSSYSEVSAGNHDFNIIYGSGPVHGKFGVEKVTLAGDYTVDQQTFAIVASTDGLGKVYSNAKFDGILGLAFPTISRDPGVNTVIPNLKEKGGLDHAMFAFYLADNADGELAIGGYNKDRMEGDEKSINWIPLLMPSYWIIGVDKVTFGGKEVHSGKVAGIMDTGTSLIYGPKAVVMPMATSLGAQYVPQVSLFMVNCNTQIPDLEFTIGGQPYNVPGNKLKIMDKTKQFCFFSVAIMMFGGEASTQDQMLEEEVAREMLDAPGTPTSPIPPQYSGQTWLIGDNFLRTIYSLYDYDEKRFGIAKLKV
ncbi:hypothetical protein ACHAWF_004021 [Thalassiosira exigua]